MSELTNIQKGIVKQLKCHYCNFYLSFGPIRINLNGQGICGRCMPEEESDKTIIRNLQYENAMTKTRFPCVYDEFGCKEILQFDHVISHENNCLYKSISCPSLKECAWRGASLSVFDHFESHGKLILKNEMFEICLSKDNACNLMTEKNGITVLLQSSYTAKGRMLYFDAVYFSAENKEILCKVSLIDGVDPDFVFNVKPFKCHPYISKNINCDNAQKISIKSCVPAAIKNQENIFVKVCLNVNLIDDYLVGCSKSFNTLSLEELKCSSCCIYMVPPIVINGNNRCCQSCDTSGVIDKSMDDYVKRIQYPCRWNECQFIGKFDNIRAHEENCKFAYGSCPLASECRFIKHTVTRHLETLHSCEWFYRKITINLVENKKYYCLFNDQVFILYVLKAEDNTKYDLLVYKLFTCNDTYEVSYHYIHSHCKLTSNKNVEHVTSNELRFVLKDTPLPKCFSGIDGNYLMVVKISKQDSRVNTGKN